MNSHSLGSCMLSVAEGSRDIWILALQVALYMERDLQERNLNYRTNTQGTWAVFVSSVSCFSALLPCREKPEHASRSNNWSLLVLVTKIIYSVIFFSQTFRKGKYIYINFGVKIMELFILMFAYNIFQYF